MKIIFNLFNCGLGQNGGSQTIVRAANMLQSFGHEVMVISSCKNFFTWEPLYARHIVVKNNLDSWPKADIIISTGVHTIPSSIEYSEKFKIKNFSWLRAWELWQQPEQELIKLYSHPNINLMANSSWLTEHVSNSTRKQCKLQYSGIPFEKFYPVNVPRDFGITRIGGLAHSTKQTKRWHNFINLARKVKEGWFRHFEFVSLSDTNIGNNEFIKEFCIQPNEEEKRKFYSSIDLWVATSKLEGCHIVPMEAALCGACVIAPGNMRSGTHDYAIDGYSAKLYNTDEELFKWVMHLVFHPNLRKKYNKNLIGILKNKIGSVEDNMRKMEKILEESL